LVVCNALGNILFSGGKSVVPATDGYDKLHFV
jgi:hypothetical protein